MKKKALIICDTFPPYFAPRMGYLCKYLKDCDWDAFVLSADITCDKHNKDFSFLSKGINALRLQISDDEINHHKKKRRNSFLMQLKYFFLPDYNHRPTVNEKLFSAGVIAFQNNHFDIILCSTSEITPLGAANLLSKHFNVPRIADLRDIDEQNKIYDRISYNDKIVSIKRMLRRNYLLKKAAAVVSVSKWHVDFLKKMNPKTYLIYNGFDPDLFKYETPRNTDIFSLCYMGIVTDTTRDLTNLFAALSLLIKNKIINQNKVKLHFYSDRESHKYIMNHAKHHQIEFLLALNDYVKGVEVPEILHQHSILLLLANKSSQNGPHGIMTTKFYEYLATGRPILLSRSDESCLEQALTEANAGLAARKVDDVYCYIKEKYHEWEKKGHTVGTTNYGLINKYSRKTQAKEFASIFEEIAKISYQA